MLPAATILFVMFGFLAGLTNLAFVNGVLVLARQQTLLVFRGDHKLTIHHIAKRGDGWIMLPIRRVTKP